MVCPKCGGRVKVVQTVYNPWQKETYRHRVCTECGHLFHTVEFEVEVNKRFMDDWNKHKNH